MHSSNGNDVQSPLGAVELREDAPLHASASSATSGCAGAGGPRLVLACFGALSAAITLALFTQIYYGDYEVVPHGSVSSDAAECSRAGTDALKAGGRALDAAVAAALCLAVIAPHRTSLDSGGSLLYWEYRQARTRGPALAEWGAVGTGAGSAAAAGERPPRLVAALAALHAELGVLPWSQLLQPAITFASDGFLVSEGLATALAAAPGAFPPPAVGSSRSAPALAAYLRSLQHNSSLELSKIWGTAGVRRSSAASVATGTAGGVLTRVAGGARLYAGDNATQRAVRAALQPPPADLDDAERRVVSALQLEAAGGVASGVASSLTSGVASGLAVVDSQDTYAALVTGLSAPFGSGPGAAAGWRRDEPARALDLAPAIMVDDHICGTRYVLGAESAAALAQAVVALAAGEGARAAVERARLVVGAGGVLLAEAARVPAAPTFVTATANASAPYAAVNVVQQAADALLSYADSRGGGISSRF